MWILPTGQGIYYYENIVSWRCLQDKEYIMWISSTGMKYIIMWLLPIRREYIMWILPIG